MGPFKQQGPDPRGVFAGGEALKEEAMGNAGAPMGVQRVKLRKLSNFNQ